MSSWMCESEHEAVSGSVAFAFALILLETVSVRLMRLELSEYYEGSVNTQEPSGVAPSYLITHSIAALYPLYLIASF